MRAIDLSAVWPRLAAVDARLMACRRRTQSALVAITWIAVVLTCVPYVPRAYLDYAGIPLLRHVAQAEQYGTDTIADMYEAKVVLHDWRDMYTKRGVGQTPLEARTWSRAASAPYPPAALLLEAALYWLGARTGVGFYGLILGLALVFFVQAAVYCLRTRWYVFPLMAVSGVYFTYRFTAVQDGTYLLMLVAIMAALLSARRAAAATHYLMGLAIAIKVSPVYYATYLRQMRPAHAIGVVMLLLTAFVLPYFLLPNYLYIFTFQNEIKGGLAQTVGAALVTIPFAVLLGYVDVRRGFDWEDRVGWALIPVAMFLAYKMNVARHLLIVLLVPDKRGVRTAAAAVSMAPYYLAGGHLPLNSVLPLCTALLFAGLAFHLRHLPAADILDDVRHPGRTALMVLRGRTRRDYRSAPSVRANRTL
jgi:hypothetical protein